MHDQDPTRSLDDLTRESFEPHVGTVFELVVEGLDGLALVLIEAENLELSRHPERFRRPFALRFRGPGEPILVQRIYRLEHAEMGVFDIFLVPVGPDEEGLVYEAVFQ